MPKMMERGCRECGAAFQARVSDVLRGRGFYCSRSCTEAFTGRHRAGQLTSHGQSVGHRRTPEYSVWLGIRDRCRRKPEYAGRGIAMCERWLASFEAFLADVGPRPSPDLWIERIDNDGHYEPGNVKWATIREQTRNRRTSRLVTFQGITACLAEWSDRTGIAQHTIGDRLDRDGWDIERALTTPSRQVRRR